MDYKRKLENLLVRAFGRVVLTGAMILLQIVLLILVLLRFGQYFVYFYLIMTALSIVVVLHIINQDKENPAYKLAWCIPILIVPVFGGLFYLMFGVKRLSSKMRMKMLNLYGSTLQLLRQDPAITRQLEEEDSSVANQSRYISKTASFPVYQNTYVEYLSPGEVKFERLKSELRKAQRYIFLEYFIIGEGVMWDEILEILLEKVAEGLDVRLIYDDMGSLLTVPFRYWETLEKQGIRCRAFNPFRPFLSVKMNNRDHRKIAVIDGHTAFTGGINIADEYINVKERFGHWKDASIMLKGEAVWSFTVMFLQMWDYLTDERRDYEEFRAESYPLDGYEATGYVQPYTDSPLDQEPVGELVYLNIINRAKRYVYINTPYLIVDNEMVTALTLAAKNGVDVRIVTPHIPDKWYVHAVTRAYYTVLIESGVKIYEYTPGFIHSKTFLSDDEIGVVGTINLDYRSLYLHFECGAWMYRTACLDEMKQDYMETLKVCKRITYGDCQKLGVFRRLGRAVLRLFAPLM